MANNVTQITRIIEYMREHGTITPLEAQTELGVSRLAARIADIRASGTPIRSRIVERTNRFGEVTRVAQYWMEADNE